MVKKTAIITFLIGTLLLSVYYFTSNFALLYVGLAFVVIAFVVNIAVLFSAWRSYKKKPDSKKLLWSDAGTLLLNVPVLFLYALIAVHLTNVMRVHFSNTNPVEISEIKIEGCDSKSVAKLLAGESKTVWIPITQDCEIMISYRKNGQLITEEVAGYLTPGMGERIHYSIGSNPL